jgi:hypothetical protein
MENGILKIKIIFFVSRIHQNDILIIYIYLIINAYKVCFPNHRQL